jgi:hypothetical protein
MVVRRIEQNYVSLSLFIAITVVAWDIIQVAAVVQCVFIHGGSGIYVAGCREIYS